MVQVFSPRGGPTGLIATLAKWGMTIIDVVSGAGAITKYTIGPAWTGAEFATWGAAIAQAVIDGHSTAVSGEFVQFEVYPVRYTEAVVFPDTLPRFVVRGSGAGDVGTTLNGTLTVNMPSANASAAFYGAEIIGAAVVNQPAPTSVTNINFRLESCSLFSNLTVNSSTIVGGCVVNCLDTDIFGAVTATARSWRHEGGQHRNVNINVGGSTEISVRQMGTTGANLFTLTSGAFSRVTACPSIFGRLVFNGASCLMWDCVQNYDGSPAVTDNCTVSSFCQGNTFSHDAGPVGPVWVQTSTALFHDGGNIFTEGQTYPWYQLGTGGRTDRSESDNELRRVTTLAGSPILTPGEVGSQRKTTIAKVNGGGVVTLPLASAVEPGCTVVVKDLNGSATASPFTVAPQGADLIDGGVVPSISTNYGAITFQQMSTTDWGIIARYL